MNVLFFGLGSVGQRHLRNLLKINPDARIAAIRKKGRLFEIGYDLQPDYNTDIVRKYKIELFSSLKEAKAFNPDFAIVANPTSQHVPTALELAANDIPIFLEKPISESFDQLQDLVQLAQERDVPIMVGYMMRFHPGAIKMKELIDNKKIGKIYSVILIVNSYMPSWHKYEQYNESYAGKKSLGGGVVVTEIHELDLLNWYFGSPQRLWAVGGKLSSLDIDVEDTVGILFEQEFDREKFPIVINMSFAQKAMSRKMLIHGERGKIEWDILASKITVEDKADNQQQVYDYPEFQRNDMFITELKYFIECLNKKTEPSTSLNKVLGGHSTALAIKDSLDTKSIVEYPDVLRRVTV